MLVRSVFIPVFSILSFPVANISFNKQRSATIDQEIVEWNSFCIIVRIIPDALKKISSAWTA